MTYQSSDKHAGDPVNVAQKRVLVIDDSPAIRSMLRLALNNDPRLNVVGEADDAYDAREKIKALRPDVITLDIEMPRMSGLEFLDRLMRLRPMPVVMFSSLTQKGSDSAVRSLALGAIDCIGKPNNGFSEGVLQDLCDRVYSASNSQSRPAQSKVETRPNTQSNRRWSKQAILVGASTGGVAAVEVFLRGMPPDSPPIIISQHMPASFLASFAARLDQLLPFDVRLAADDVPLESGQVLIAPGGEFHCGVREAAGSLKSRIWKGPKREGHRPSVDEMFLSAVEFSDKIAAVILTGLGRDGAAGMKALHEGGAYCVAQDQDSCVVYGMPKVAVELGAVDSEVALEKIAADIFNNCSSNK